MTQRDSDINDKRFYFWWFHSTSLGFKQFIQTDNSQQSFLFSVKDYRKSGPQFCPLANPCCVIHFHLSNERTFGGVSLYLTEGCNKNTSSYIYPGSRYRNGTRLSPNQVFTGEQSFQLKQIEVFSISPSITIKYHFVCETSITHMSIMRI
jgi:hypothetical protein